MNVLVLLAMILGGLMMWIGGWKGMKSFVSLFFNFGVLMLTIILMTDVHLNPYLIAIVACIAISCISLFFINEVNSKTITAFISVVVTISLLLLFINILIEKSMIQGFGEEEIDELIGVYNLYLGIDFVKVATAVVVMSTVGAIIDVAISITSPMQEIFYLHPKMKQKELYGSGLRIGKDILGSNANTLFFAFLGGHFALFLWFKDLDYSFGRIVNSKIFAAEILTIFCAGLGIALVIPVASWISSYYLIKIQNSQKKREE